MKKTKKIEVAVRMRPLLQEFEDIEAWTVNEEQGRVSSIPKGQVGRGGIEEGLGRRKSKVEMNNIYEFSLDYVFKDIHSNWQVYSQCSSRVVQDFLAGNNATIFMYGQTTTGKTYTMLGDQRTEGLIIYSLRDIFTSKAPGTHIDISYLEIYNEQINDLLKQGSVNLKIVD